MLSGWQWISILAIGAAMLILSPNDKENGDYKNYNCYDKSPYKCGKCKKNCKWRYIVQKYEELKREDED